MALHFHRDENGTSSSDGRGRARQTGGDGVQGRVASLGAGRVAGHERADVLRRGAAQRLNAVQHQVAVGERAGLVQADGVDVGQRLDRVHVLHEHALARQPHGADREGEAHQQHQPFGDHGDDAGRGGRDSLAKGRIARRQRPHQGGAQGHHHRNQQPQQLVHLLLERGALRRVLPGGAQQLPCVAVGAGAGDDVAAAALDAERPRQHALALGPRHRQRLTGQRRLVQHQAHRARHIAVGHHLVAGAERDQVSVDDVVQVQHPLAAVPHHPRLRRHQQRGLVEHAFGAQLLDDPDRGVRDQDAREQAVRILAADQDQHQEDGQDQVEQRQRVRPHDALDRAAGGRRRDISPLREASRGLLLAETGGGGLRLLRLLNHGGQCSVLAMSDGTAPLVGVIMGSRSDWETMRHAVETLEQLEVPHEHAGGVGPSHARICCSSTPPRPASVGSRC